MNETEAEENQAKGIRERTRKWNCDERNTKEN